MSPPMAVPLSYQDTTKWNRWESSWVSGIFLAGVVLDRIRWGSQDAASEAHHGDLDVYDGGEIRGFRLGAVGTINFRRPWVYTVLINANYRHIALNRAGIESNSDAILTRVLLMLE